MSSTRPPQPRRRRAPGTIATTITAAVIGGVWLACGGMAAAGQPGDEPPALRVDTWFPGGIWQQEPVVVTADNALADQFPLEPGSEPLAAPENDLTVFALGITAPLDDATFDTLTGPDGLLAGGATGLGVYGPTGELVTDARYRAYPPTLRGVSTTHRCA